MKSQKIKLVYFSPTGTTKKVLDGIAKGINAEVSSGNILWGGLNLRFFVPSTKLLISV